MERNTLVEDVARGNSCIKSSVNHNISGKLDNPIGCVYVRAYVFVNFMLVYILCGSGSEVEDS